MIIVIIITNILDTLNKRYKSSYFRQILYIVNMMLFILLPQLIGHNHIQINFTLYTVY